MHPARLFGRHRNVTLAKSTSPALISKDLAMMRYRNNYVIEDLTRHVPDLQRDAGDITRNVSGGDVR